MEKLFWKTEKRKVIDLVPFEMNPRMMSVKQAEDLRKSIEKFNLAEIPAVNTDNRIVAGHQRLMTMKLLGRDQEEIDVRVPNRPLTDEEFQEYNLRSNKNVGEWNWDMLANIEMPMLKEAGFTKEELGGLRFPMLNDEDEVPELPKEPTAKLGDIFQLGNHRIMCGDSTKREDVEKLMNGGKADMVFTDPPYGVNYSERARQIVNQRKDGLTIQNDNLNFDDLKSFVFLAFQNIKEFLKIGGVYYICSPQGGGLGMMMMMMMMMKEAGIECRHSIIWKKDSPVFSMGRLDYDYQHEPILYGWIGTHKHYGRGKFKTSVWDIPKSRNSKLHPTMKPVELVENSIQNSSKAEDIVLDLFLGSGSTLIACQKTGRVCYGMEIDPLYVDVVVERWEKATGQKSQKIS